MTKIDPRELRNAFGSFLSGVTVVTAVSKDGTPVGFTANSYTSVSLDPPLLLVCPARSLSSYPVFEQCSNFVVNILAEDQQHVSNTFAQPGDDRFGAIDWHEDRWKCPVIDQVAASFSCSPHERVEAGDHMVLIGHINEFSTSNRPGLGYSRDGYFSLALERKAADLPKTSSAVMVGAIIEHDGYVLLEDTDDGVRPPQTVAADRTGSLDALRGFLAEHEIDAELGLVYSVFDSPANGDSWIYYRGTTRTRTSHFGRYVPIDQLRDQRYVSEAVSTMMNRYSLENEYGVFGLYVGSDHEGEVHMFGEGISS